MSDPFPSRTAAQITTSLTAWHKAFDALATAQTYTITEGGMSRTLTRADLPSIERAIAQLEKALQAKNGTRVRRTHIKIVS